MMLRTRTHKDDEILDDEIEEKDHCPYRTGISSPTIEHSILVQNKGWALICKFLFQWALKCNL
jgi:hypothetical protein